ncbi:MAG: glycoside hydrolase family 30 protein [Caldanaerobacter sp.]
MHIEGYVTAKDYKIPFAKLEDIEKRDTKNKASLVKIYPDEVLEEVIGFGGALTEAAAYNISSLPYEKQGKILKDYFDEKEGLGYKLVRIHMNSCDFSLESYSCDDVEGDIELKYFNIERDKKWVIPLLKRIKELVPDLKILVSSWSPPAWMKTNNNMKYGGKLREEYRKTWAEFFVKFIKAYQDEGIDIWAVTVQNEPMAVQIWESCIYTAEEERDFVKYYLGPAFLENGLSHIKILIWDHNKDIIYERVKTVLEDKEASKYVWGVGFHWYAGDHFEQLKKIKEEFPYIKLVFTEGTQEGGVNLGSWKLGERYAHEIIGDFNNYTVGFFDWNIVLDTMGGPNHVKNYCDAPIIVDTEKKEIFYQSSYYYIGHFSKFIKPGSKTIKSETNDPRLEVLSAKTLEGKIIAVIMNKTEENIDVLLDIDDNLYTVPSIKRSIETFIIG